MKLEIEIPNYVIEKDDIKEDIIDIIKNGINYIARINNHLNLEKANIIIKTNDINNTDENVWKLIEKYYGDDIKHNKLDAIRLYQLYNHCNTKEAYDAINKHFTLK